MPKTAGGMCRLALIVIHPNVLIGFSVILANEHGHNNVINADRKMKNKIIVCFMSLLGFASCSDSNEELGDTTFSDTQTSSSGDWVAVLIDGLYTKWSAGLSLPFRQQAMTDMTG